MTPSSTRDPATTLRTSDNASDPAVSWKVKCLNCGAALAGPFCAECGQRALPPHPTVRELIGDAVVEFSGWDGKFSETLRTLIRKPGELTRQWLDGRRAHYISPLRLYLTASLVFFLVQSSAPNVGNRHVGPQFSFGPSRSPKPAARAQRVPVSLSNAERAAAAAQKALDSKKPLTPAERDSVMTAISKAPWIIKPMLVKSVDNPTAFVDAVRRNVPRMLFALLPVYAGVLALFYRRRNYPEHLYFAIHLHSFVFMALLIGELATFTHVNGIAAAAGTVSIFWIVGYSLVALRRVYGGSWRVTIAKGIGIMILYGIIALPTMLLTILLAAF